MSVDLLRYVRDVADFPKPGVVFKDLTPIAFLDGRARWMHEAPLHAVLRF
jgi:hypothetical protein